MKTIEFDGITLPLQDDKDASIEEAKRYVEFVLGRALPLSPKTAFPEFTIRDENGEEIAGG